jgi:hypothetical protein
MSTCRRQQLDEEASMNGKVAMNRPYAAWLEDGMVEIWAGSLLAQQGTRMIIVIIMITQGVDVIKETVKQLRRQ